MSHVIGETDDVVIIPLSRMPVRGLDYTDALLFIVRNVQGDDRAILLAFAARDLARIDQTLAPFLIPELIAK